jgi:hypothetical protein
MITGIDKNETFQFISSADAGEEKTIFILGILAIRDKLNILKGAFDEKGKVNPSIVQEKAIDIIKAGLKEIKNFCFKGEKKDVKEITDEVIEQIPINIIAELASKLVEINFMSEAERKN